MKRIATLLIVLISFKAPAQQVKAERIDSLFTAMNLNNEFNGVVLFAENGHVIHQKAYGKSDFDQNVPLSTSSVFDLASVSKQFTAAAIMLLKKGGKLALKDPISKFLPELSFYEGITIENLLTHTSGLADYMNLMSEHWDHSKIATNKDVIDMMALKKPVVAFEPGASYAYSNTGYLLLASIIEKASGQAYGAYLEEQIFDPLAMTSTLVNRPRYQPRAIQNLTKGHVNGTDGLPVSIDTFGKDQVAYYLDGIVGDGMVNSTVTDLYLWDRALYTDKLFPQTDKDLIFTSYVLNDGSLTGYGYGWDVKDHPTYGSIVGHSGSWAGYLTFIERHVSNDKVFIMLQNTSLMSTGNPIHASRKILYNEPIEIITYTKKTYPTEELKSYEGTYKNEEIGMHIEIALNDNQLTAQATGQGAFPLEGYQDHYFKFEPAGILIHFSDDKSSFKITQGGSTMTFTR